MPNVSANYVHAMTAAVGLSISAQGEVLDGTRVVFRLEQTPDGRVHAASFFDLIAWISERQPDRLDWVSAYAKTVHVDNLGVLGLAIKTAPTFRASIERLTRYSHILADTAAYRFEAEADPVVLAIESQSINHPAVSLRNECALAAFIRNAQCFAQADIPLTQLSFRHSCAGDPARYAEYFGCPVFFDAPRDAIYMPMDVLDMPNRIGDAAVSEYLTVHLDAELEALSVKGSLCHDVRRRLSECLSGGVPQASRLAEEMGMSERTFFRRLADEGTTFRDVVREAQVSLAQELLVHSDCALAEIAFLTGFAEQSTFGRAFKRWTGEAPAAYRAGRSTLQLRPKPPPLAETAKEMAAPANTQERSAH